MKYEYVYESVSLNRDTGQYEIRAEYQRDGFTRAFNSAVEKFSQTSETLLDFRRQFREALKEDKKLPF